MVDPTYCTSSQVAAFLQVPKFNATTSPTKEEVDEMIIESEDDINRQTLNSWKSKTITKEYHTIKPAIHRYEGTQIFIDNRNITALSTGDGDKLEVFNGSEWEDYLVSRTEGRTNDYWINLIDGIIWLKTYPRILRRTNDVRLTYRFKEPSVPGDIKRACIRLTAISIIESDDKSILFPEGSSNIPLTTKSEKWQERADKIIQNNRELKVAIL